MKYHIPITPVPASRPRVTRWSTYYGKQYTEFLREFPGVCPTPQETLGCNLYVVAEFVCKRPKKITRENPNGDIDNFAKALFDAMTKQEFWVDDMQICHTTLTKRYAEPQESPCINVEIYEYEKS